MNQNESGYSLIEVLVSLAIIGGAIATLTNGIFAMSAAKKKMAIANAAVALQSKLIDEFSNETRYFGVVVAGVYDPNRVRDPMSLTNPITYSIEASNGGSSNVQRGVPAFFNENLQSCGAFSPSCQIQLQFNFQLMGSVHRAAYRISINPDLGIPFGNLGTMTTPATNFAATDYRIPLPDILKKLSSEQKCDGPDDVGIREINRDTGEVKCLKKPDGGPACGPGTILKGYVADVNDRLVPNCAGAASARIWTCPDHYRLQSIPDPRVFDSQFSGPPPVCVWMAQASETVGTGVGPTTYINGLACPRPGGPDRPNAYIMNANCTTAYGAPSNGTCYTIPGCTTVGVVTLSPPPPTFIVPGPGTGPGTDSIFCQANAGVSDMSGCAGGGIPGVYPGTVSFPGGRVCSLTLPEQVSATGSP